MTPLFCAVFLAYLPSFDATIELRSGEKSFAVLPAVQNASADEPSERVRAAVQGLPGVTLQAKGDTVELRGDASCAIGTLGCQVILGERLGVQLLLFVVQDVDGNLKMTATDVVSRLPLGSKTYPANTDRAQERLAIRDDVAMFFLPSEAHGSIIFRGVDPESEITVDGIRVDHDDRLTGLSLGKHAVALRRPDGTVQHRFVSVHVGQETVVSLDDVETRANTNAAGDVRAVEDWVFWGSGAALAVVGTGALIGAGGLYAAQAAALAEPLPAGATSEDVQARLDQWNDVQVWLWTLGIGGGVALLSGAALGSVPLIAE